jgi:hypothetical protein
MSCKILEVGDILEVVNEFIEDRNRFEIGDKLKVHKIPFSSDRFSCFSVEVLNREFEGHNLKGLLSNTNGWNILVETLLPNVKLAGNKKEKSELPINIEKDDILEVTEKFTQSGKTFEKGILIKVLLVSDTNCAAEVLKSDFDGHDSDGLLTNSKGWYIKYENLRKYTKKVGCSSKKLEEKKLSIKSEEEYLLLSVKSDNVF